MVIKDPIKSKHLLKFGCGWEPMDMLPKGNKILIKVWPHAKIIFGFDTNEMNKFHLLNMR
jgi:hypothetical protein